MADFPLENPDNPLTSGDGKFLNSNNELYNQFYKSDSLRCKGFLVDRPPHDSLYFLSQLKAVGNYYKNVSGGKLLFTADIITNPNSPENGYYTVSDSMEYYAKADTSLAKLFSEALNTAKADIEEYFDGKPFSPDDVVFVVFHAGLGQDISYPYLDPTVYDLKSAYLEESMFKDKKTNTIVISPAEILDEKIYTGVLLPETQNIIYFDVVEDIFYGSDDLCDIQIGLTGIFAFLLGYELGLPPMFNNDSLSTNYGDSGVGYFGLMDHGSNNGRGVFPSPPTPWTRSIIADWSEVINIDTLTNTDSILVEAYNTSNKIYKIAISEDEYFLIENRNNQIIPGYDIEYLRYLLRDNYLCDNCNLNCDGLNISEIADSILVIKDCVDDYPFSSDKLHYFDVIDTLIKHNPSLINIEDIENNILTGFTNYDLGLPGTGILIWHIKEPIESKYSVGINNNRDNRFVQIEEADGSLDIGFESFAFFTSDDPTTGTSWDMWFKGNEAYEFGNPGSDEVIFDNWSSPNSRTTDGAESFLSISILSEVSERMYIRVNFYDGIEIVNLSEEPVQYLGNAVENNIGFIFYGKGDSIYRHSHGSGAINIDEYIPDQDSIILTCNTTLFDTLFITKNQYAWIDTLDGQFHEDYIAPRGYIDHPDTAHFFLASSDSSLSFGDLDQDGLDEIITIEYGDIIAKNSNGTLINGFPIKGDFWGVPLIANILPPKYATNDAGKPEVVCREGDDIIILSNRGERLRQLSSYDIDQPLAMVPYWRGDTTIALIDGSRLFLFDLDLDHSYWLNPRSRPSGFPVPTGEHFNPPAEKGTSGRPAYNYPNPITEGKTTFRFFIGSPETNKVQIKIYNAAGYLVVDDLATSDLTSYEFNEIPWNNIQVEAGLYLAEIKPDVGSSELVRLVVIK